MFKFTHMVTHENPNITGYDIEDGMSETEVNLNKHNFRMAFTVESFLYPLQQKNDPRYVKYIVRMYGKRNGEYYQRILPYHKCTDEDFKDFYPVKKQSTNSLQAIRKDPERGMFCLDWNDDPIALIGDSYDDDYTRLEILF